MKLLLGLKRRDNALDRFQFYADLEHHFDCLGEVLELLILEGLRPFLVHFQYPLDIFLKSLIHPRRLFVNKNAHMRLWFDELGFHLCEV